MSSIENNSSFSLTKAHIDQLQGDTISTDGNDEDAGESADIFGQLGSETMPWKRVSTSTTDSNSNMQHDNYISQNTAFKEISDMTKNVYDSFDKREMMIKTSYTNTRFFMIENFSDTELLKYEMLLKEMRNRSILKDAEEIGIKLDQMEPSVSVEDLRDKKIASIKTSWLMKILKASEDHVNKANLVRNMFRRTHDFFNELNEMEYQYITKKHLREIAKQDILHKLRSHDEQSPHMTERMNSMEISQQKELQFIQFKNIKEVYVRMVQKEWSAMDNHLSMLEELYQALHKIYVDVMNLKIKNVNEWYEFRIKKDQSLRDSVKGLQDCCYEEFRAYKESERKVELNGVKDSAEHERTKRFNSYSEAETVISSELVFGMTMKRQKALYVLEEASEGSYDGSVTEGSSDHQLEGNNVEFLAYIRERMHQKSQIEEKNNRLLHSILSAHKTEESTHLEVNRKREREYMKLSMEKYFTLERKLGKKIQMFLDGEKRAIEQLKMIQSSDLESVLNTHDLEFQRMLKLENNYQVQVNQGKVSVQTAITVCSKKEKHKDTMITAHVFHEVRNVLASIICLGENIKEDPSRVDDYINEQFDICHYALDTMNDMLDVAKIKTSSYKVRQDVVNIGTLLDEVIKLQGQRANKNVVVSKSMGATVETIVTEKRLLRQFLVNLLSNAAKFTMKGHITLVATAVVRNSVECIKIGVVDTGSGMSPKISTKINNNEIADGDVSEGFIETQSEKSANISILNEYTARSSGYGLYLASTIAKTLGGSLKVVSPLTPQTTSQPIHPDFPGSFFYTVLPVNAANEAVEKTNIQTVTAAGWRFNPCGKMTVLIVDDQKLLRHAMISIFRQLCEQFDLEVDISTASSAEEAIRKKKTSEYDFISMDEHYDQSVLARNVFAKQAEQSPLPLHLDSDVEENRQRCIQFKAQENFHILSTDGVLLGTDAFVELNDSLTKPIIISCTGASNVVYPQVMKKPYTLQSFIELMEASVSDFLKRKLVTLDGRVIRKNSQLTLYSSHKSVNFS
jgi:signal transduction histidine kinase/CheY-like chemotaxis protein